MESEIFSPVSLVKKSPVGSESYRARLWLRISEMSAYSKVSP
jgi:hypothetical protein